ncbi:hypothetical protein [Jannaschia aquimarina]|uniref:Uncharacterized protein n=1 Tax=Jannaschia aquimarina TaxID=935700 RepID=A0A0D1CRM7_9RHOB|nr:hypothetical protein [Jannaschia aquimarina]KIT17442.1 hypothetical protein jaqu_06300 [Jannaschia aquimarina]SNS75981.1 hypothetical protein SAMN05421775_102180 [Jannaschia aquimarina]
MSRDIGAMVGLPLRDLARGLSAFTPIRGVGAAGLPAPLREALQLVSGVLPDSHPERVPLEGVDAASLAAASDFLSVDGPSDRMEEAFVRVLASAMQMALDQLDGPAIPLSETIATMRLHSGPVAAGVSAERRAARILLDLYRARAFGPMPGLPLPTDPAQDRAVRLAAFAAFAWLLTNREDVVSEERLVLELSVALSVSLEAEVLARFDDPDTLAEMLRSVSAKL